MMKFLKCSSDFFRPEGRKGRDPAVTAATLGAAASLFYWESPHAPTHSRRARWRQQDPCKLLLLQLHDSGRVSLAANSEDDWELYLQTNLKIKKYKAQRCWNPVDHQEVAVVVVLQYFSTTTCTLSLFSLGFEFSKSEKIIKYYFMYLFCI